MPAGQARRALAPQADAGGHCATSRSLPGGASKRGGSQRVPGVGLVVQWVLGADALVRARLGVDVGGLPGEVAPVVVGQDRLPGALGPLVSGPRVGQAPC